MAVASAIYVCDASGVGDAASGVGDADGQLSTDATPPTEYSVSSQTITRVSSRVPAQEPTRLRVRRAQNPRCVELALVHHVELVPIEPRLWLGLGLGLRLGLRLGLGLGLGLGLVSQLSLAYG